MTRVFSVFREVNSPYEIPEAEAYGVALSATRILSRRLGMVGITGLRPLEIPPDINQAELALFHIENGGMHNVIMTRRLLPAENGQGAGRGGVAYLLTDLLTNRAAGTQTMISVAPPNEAPHAIAIAHTAHQMTHTFGVDHCAQEACIMQPCTDVPSNRLQSIMEAENPYCFEHDIELGRIATAVQAEQYD